MAPPLSTALQSRVDLHAELPHCVICNEGIQPLELYQIGRRYRAGRIFEVVYRCAKHFLVYDLEWGPLKGWHQGEVDRATYQGGTENYGQGYSWASLPDGQITGASFCKSCGRLLDFENQLVQMSILVRDREIVDVLYHCSRHW